MGSVHKLTQDPVQIGGIYDVLIGGGGGCRNLLDVQDMDIDFKGRIYIGWADGCTGQCATEQKPETTGYRDRAPRVLRQVGGYGLFKEFDAVSRILDIDGDGIDDAVDPYPTIVGVDTEKPEQESPGIAPTLLLLCIAAFAVLRRRMR